MAKKENPGFKDTGERRKDKDYNSGDSGKFSFSISKKQLYIIIGIVVVIIIAAVSVPVYQNYIEPFNRTVISITKLDSDSKNKTIDISMRYLLERIRIADSDANTMLYQITDEQLIRMAAPRYGIVVTEDDVDQRLKSMAAEGDEEISDIEYKEWLRQKLNENDMSEDQLREIVEINLLTNELEQYLAENLPRTAEQVYLHLIVIQDYEEALQVVERINNGEDFAEIAKELSIDEYTKDQGGEYGWIVPEISIFDAHISRMELNKVSQPIPYYASTGSTTNTSDTSAQPDAYYILKITERESEREVDDSSYAALQSMALESWLASEYAKYDIKFNFNSETLAWINWQLSKDE